MELAIMIEGQNGLNWPRWQRIAGMVEELGFAGLYRSDHYTNGSPPDRDSLELWISLAWLASYTSHIEFGPLVSPVSFRHPTMTARMAAAVDDLSAGRLVLGLGAGWQEREHTHFGWDLLDLKGRFERFEEGLMVISGLLKDAKPMDFYGHYFHLQEAILLPRPARAGGPPILIGGNGEKRTLGLVARYADEWNAVFIPASEFIRLNQVLDARLAEMGRTPASVRRSLMTGLVFGRDAKEATDQVDARTQGQRTVAELRQRGIVAGGPEEVLSQLQELAASGVQRVMLQWLELDDTDRLEAFARALLPHFPSLPR